jgi:hypothetical protein
VLAVISRPSAIDHLFTAPLSLRDTSRLTTWIPVRHGESATLRGKYVQPSDIFANTVGVATRNFWTPQRKVEGEKYKPLMDAD